MSTRTFKGKEYLLDDVNFIGTFNPFINNTYDATIEDSVSNTPVDVYIFDTTNYPELTKEQFASVKTVSEIISSGTGTPSTYLTTNGLFNFNLDKPTQTKTINLNSTLSFVSTGLYPVDQDQTIYDNIFIVLKVQETKTGKTYTDIPTREQLLLIPSSVLTEKNITLDFLIPGPNDTVWNETFGTGITNTILTNISLGGAIINTGKRIYYYGGIQGWNNITNNTTRDDAYYYSTVDVDGNISASSAKVAAHPINKLLYMGTCVAGPNKEFIYTFGGYNTSNLNVSNIYRSTIDLNTGIPGAYTSIANLPVALRYTAAIVSDDGLTIYVFGGAIDSGSNTNKIYVYSVNPTTGTITLTNTITLDTAFLFSAAHVPFILNNAIYFTYSGFIYRIKLINSVPESTIEKVGTLAPSVKGALAWFSLINDFENVYLIGGYASTSVKTSDEIHKISKSDLISASSTNLKSTSLITTKVPLQIYNYNPYIPSTKKYYLIAGIIRKYTEQGTSDANVTSTGGNWLLPKTQAQSKIKMDSLQVVKSNDPLLEVPKEEFFRGKLYRRYRDEHKSKLFLKQVETDRDPLTNLVQFVYQSKTIPITRINNLYIISDDCKKLLNWIETSLIPLDALEKYRNYLSDKSVPILIPEIILDMLLDKNFKDLNLAVLKLYNTDLNGEYTEEQLIKILNDFSKCYIPNINISNVPDQNKDFSKVFESYTKKFNKKSDYDISENDSYLFFPFRNYDMVKNKISNFLTYYNNLFTFPKSNFKINSLMTDDYTDYLTTYDQLFDLLIPSTATKYYIAPSGVNTNNGLTKTTPKRDFSGIPSGSYVILLPGTYSGMIDDGGYGAQSYLFAGTTNSFKIYGYGSSTVIQIRDKVPATRDTSIINNKPNMTFNFVSFNYYSAQKTNGYSASYEVGFCRFSSSPLFLNCIFTISGYYTLTYFNNATWEQRSQFLNCTFSGGTKLGDYGGSSEILNGTYYNGYEWIKLLIPYIKQAKIPYTLIPLSENIEDTNNLQYDKLSRVTGINEINFEIE